MKLTFETWPECLTAFEIIDSDSEEIGRKRACVIFKNLRSFKKWNIAPLTDLNILTGPNSSGKSTLASIISNLRTSKFKEFIQASGDNTTGSAFIGVSIDWNEYIKSSDDPESYKSSIAWMHLIKIVEEFHDSRNSSKDETSKPKRITVIAESKGDEWELDFYTFVDQELVGFLSIVNDQVDYQDEAYFKISPKYWEKIYNSKYSSKIRSELDCTPQYKKNRDKHKLNKAITGEQKIEGPGYFLDIINYSKFNLEDGPNVLFGENINFLEEVSYALICINIIFIKPLKIIEKYSSDILPSLRPICTPTELQYKFEIGSKDSTNVGNLKDTSSGVATSFRNLAVEIANEKLNLHSWNVGSKNLKEVNYWLKEILNDSHKLAFRYTAVDLLDKKHPWTNSKKWKGAHVKNIFVDLFLYDSNRKELGFNDVGTGISQVLPVISSIINSDHLIFLQPELHLHPKAQTILGDLFIFAIQKNKDINAKHSGIPIRKITIETHSEHLILRLLRRIKENHNKKSDSIFSNKNLSLIYVNPQDKGSEVHWIRVDEYGEFVDVWPQGFFEDRYEDLFFTTK
jgi:predicted ATPase